MKQYILFLAILSLVCSGFSEAQSNRKKSSGKDIGDEISAEVDRIVDKLSSRWNPAQDEFDVADGDTTVSKKRSSVNDEEDVESDADAFSGDKVIEESEVIHGNMVVKGGDLTLYGKVDGDVLVVGGDLRVKSKGRITGNARVINGSIYKESGAVIEGYEDKSSASRASYREPRKKFSRSGRTFDVSWMNEQMNLDNFMFRYNRVEGIFLGVGTEKKYYWDGERPWNAYGSVGWGFKSHIWRGNLGLNRQLDRKSVV
jgi:hypothetical protein